MHLTGKQVFKHLLLLFVAVGASQGMAQNYKNHTLSARSGPGLDSYREEGTSPLTYSGICLNLGGNLSFAWRRHCIDWRHRYALFLNQNTQKTATSYGGTYHGSLGYLYRWTAPTHPSYRGWIGGGLGDQLFLSMNSSLGNAALGYSNFFDMDLRARVELDFKFRKKKEEKRFTAFGYVELPVITRMKRPGFSHISNANASSGLLELTDGTYNKHTKFFSGISTETGIAYRLRNQNRIALFYAWHFRTTGDVSAYRFYDAQHLFQCDLTFNLKHRDHESK